MHLLPSVRKFHNSKLFFSKIELSKILSCYSLGFSKGNWKDNNPDGLWEEYYENGELCSSKTFKEDKAHGLSTEYFQNGLLKSRINWVKGNIAANEEYYENGQLKFRTARHKGKRHGKFEHYNEDGSVIRIEEYDNGKLIESKTLIDSQN